MAITVGIVGVGRMGQAFALNILTAGERVVGYDSDPQRMRELELAGGKAAASAAEVARATDHVIVSLPNGEISRKVVLADDFVSALKKSAYVIDTTTAHPDESIAIARDLEQRGVRYIEAPVSGTSTMARRKDVILLMGGKRQDFEALSPVFATFTRAAYHLGDRGAAMRAKLVMNLVLQGNRLALAEGLLLGTKAGLDTETLLTVLKDGSCQSKTMHEKGHRMVGAEYEAEGQAKSALKDVQLMVAQGKEHGVDLPLITMYRDLLAKLVERGHGDKDTSAFFELLRENAGLPPRL